MAINITDGFNLNYAAPVDYRMVVANSTARLALTYKYDGLKVFQTDNRNTYLYNSGSSTWGIENSDNISGTGSTNYIPKFTGTNSTTGSWEIGNSPISASGSSVGINTNNQRGSYTYLQIGGTSLTEDPYWYAGQSLPLTIHKGGTTIIGYNWYWTGSANAYFNSAVGSSQILFSDDMAFKTRPGSGSFVYNMIINPGYVIFSNDLTGGTTKSPMIRSQGSTSYSSQTTPDFTWYGDNTTGIFIPSANTIAFTNNGTESVRITSSGSVDIGVGILATASGSVVNQLKLYSHLDSNDVNLEFSNVRNSTGPDWLTSGYRIQAKVDSYYMGYIQFNGTNNDAGISFGTGYTFDNWSNTYQVMRIDLDGRIFIGASSSTALNSVAVLQIKSDSTKYEGIVHRSINDANIIFAFQNSSGATRGNIGGINSSSIAYSTTSDKRLKTNIQEMPSMYNIVKNLKPSIFNWKDDNQEDYGFIAQEVYKLIPNLRGKMSEDYCDVNSPDFDIENPIKKDGTEHYYGLDYGKLTPYLTKALQETMEKLETLTNKIKNANTLEDLKSSL